MLLPWTEIESFYNIRKYSAAHNEILNGNPLVHYKTKVKLHGTNCSMYFESGFGFVTQSRTIRLTDNDSYGFKTWVDKNLPSLLDKANRDYIYYGEWCGLGVQAGVAASKVTGKFFAIFAARPLNADDDQLIVEPEELRKFLPEINGLYILPWHSKEMMINWLNSKESLTPMTDVINSWVEEIEVCDPWIKETFGIDGTGEGLVFYPCSKEHLGYKNFTNLVFKAKGEKHKNISKAAPAQVDPAVASSIKDFVDMVLTPARLEQGARRIAGEHKHEENLNCMFCSIPEISFDIKKTGQFVNWIAEDVKKEAQDELEASGLTFDNIQKILRESARTWYLNSCKV